MTVIRSRSVHPSVTVEAAALLHWTGLNHHHQQQHRHRNHHQHPE
uniref:Uncharacterized protein n=1 Tax=Anopheles atroparvus TaxID=41427 RepID=A0AAG5D464_ANOAO